MGDEAFDVDLLRVYERTKVRGCDKATSLIYDNTEIQRYKGIC